MLVFPHSTETRWLEGLPTPGTRIRDHRGKTWVVDEVLQSGLDTYTVHCVSRREHLDRLRDRRADDLAAELLEVARLTRDAVSERLRGRRNRDYMP